MTLNLKEYKILSFSRISLLTLEHFFGSHKLEMVEMFRDLGTLFDNKLCVNLHIELSTNKARSLTWFY